MPVINLIRTHGLSIFRQLNLEEALLRASKENWCFINNGCAQAAIVLGISGKVHELVEEEAAKKAGVQLIKRFTGGGTVIVDRNTIFNGLILNAEDLPGIECYPRPLMEWTAKLYAGVFGKYGAFSLQDQDYTLGTKKFAGNAQAITKQRFIHHTSFLWDFCDSNMKLLKHPAKTPEYRLGRSHLQFLCKLRDVASSREAIINEVLQGLQSMQFSLKEVDISKAEQLLASDYLKNNKILSG